jgi:hypothetical protein
LSTRATVASIVALGVVVSLAGDACHVASGTTRYEWDGVPVIWRSAVWFPVLLAGGVLALALVGHRWRDRLPAARARGRRDVIPAAAAVLGLYALTAALHGQPVTVSTVLVGSLAVALWAWWDPSPGAALGGVIAAIAGPLAEIAIVAVGAASYTPGSDGLAGVAPWLPGLYFAAGAVAFRLWDAVGRRLASPDDEPGSRRVQSPAAPST